MNEVLDNAAQDGPEDILDLSIGPPDYNCCRSAPKCWVLLVSFT